MSPDQSIQRGIYERMYRIFKADEEIRGMIMSGKATAIYYSPRGQEAIPAAVSAVLRQTDTITTTYRGIHDTIAKGVPLRNAFAEILGRASGVSKGKGGIMHLSDPDNGVMATSGIVGGGMPIANGLALHAQLSGTDAVTVTYFGDGATNIGAFHEALNMAAIWHLPVIFVCQNNEYGEFTPRMESMAVEQIATRAMAYGMPGVTVDGNDPDAVYAAADDAVRRARAGEGPTLIEAKTYRFMGHGFGMDSMAYMPKDEMEAALARDPMPIYRTRLLDGGAITEAELSELERSVEAEVAAAIDFALASPEPDPDDVLTDVYEEEVPV